MNPTTATEKRAGERVSGPGGAARWQELSIVGFRGLEDLTLSGLGAFNLLVGANGVGKTSVLEAALLLAAGSSKPELDFELEQLRGYPAQRVKDLQYLFRDPDSPIVLTCKDAEGVERRLRMRLGREDITVTRPKPDPGSGSGTPEPTSGSTLTSRKVRALVLDHKSTVSADGTPGGHGSALVDQDTGYAVAYRGEASEDAQAPATLINSEPQVPLEQLGQLVERGSDGRLVDRLRKLNPRIRDLRLTAQAAFVDVAGANGETSRLPLNMFGSGLVRAAQIMAHCLLSADRLLLIDEFDSGLHYESLPPLVEGLVALASEQGIQVLATTHNIDALKALRDTMSQPDLAEHRESVCCYALKRDYYKRVRTYRYDHAQFDHCIEHGLELR